MKKLLIIVLFGLSIYVLKAQTNLTVQAINHPPISFNNTNYIAPIQVNNVGQRSATCGPDSVRYLASKATSLRGLTINSASSALAQYFPAPGSMLISGAQLYAWVVPNQAATSVTVTVSLYNADVIDSLPTGSPLASKVIIVDTSFGTGQLTTLLRSADFATPVTVSNPYIIVVENNSSTSVAVVCSNWANKDGRREWLSSLKIGGIWQRSYFVTVGLDTFNSDAILEPYVTYDINPQLTADKTCLVGNDTVALTGNTDAFIDSKFYNNSFSNTFFGSYYWEFGNGSTAKNSTDTTYIFSGDDNRLVNFHHRVFGWRITCVDTASTLLAGPVTAGYSTTSNELELTIVDTSINGVTRIFDLGDGQNSIMDSFNYSYSTEGSYEICIEASNSCYSDSLCKTVSVCNEVVSDFNLTTLNESVALFSEATGADSLYWEFGDGQTSNDINPTVTYTANGFYQICLTAINTCNDSTMKSCQLIEIDFFSGIAENNLDLNMLLYPNPAANTIQVIYNGTELVEEIIVYNVFGKKVYNATWEGNKHVIDISEIPTGNYYVKLVTDNTFGWKKLNVIR